MKLKDRVAIITGASQGLGLAIARAFVMEGAAIAICARDEKTLQQAANELRELAAQYQKTDVFVQKVDVSKPDEISRFVTTVYNHFKKIDILITNAGIYGPKGPLDEIDWAAWCNTLDINLKGAVYTCKAALPYLKQNRGGKIILISGGGATKPLPYLSAYAASKAALVRFGETLAEEVRAFNIDVNAIAPGALNTRLLNEILAAGEEKVGRDFYEQALKQKESGGTPLEKGAALCVYLASSESNGITGKLLSAVWDRWDNLHTRLREINRSDIYTLRRMTEKEIS